MLIEYSVANYRSIREQQTLSLHKAAGDELADTNSFSVDNATRFPLLRSAAIYGPNAGGKSNLLQAMAVIQRLVVDSASAQQRGDKLPITPFRLSAVTAEQPSEFEVVFIAEGVRYQYGFAASANRIHAEWLIAYPKGRAQRWFDRTWNAQTQHYDWELGDKLQGEKQLWQKSTRDNALFLSTAVQLNSQQLQPVYDWFKTTLHVGNVGGWGDSFTITLCKGKEKNRVLDFLRAADLNIDDILVETEAFDPGMLPDAMPAVIKGEIAHSFKNKELFNIKTLHKTVEGNSVVFDFDDAESDGTKRLFAFAGPWLDCLANGHVLFIDELHDNLHPKLVKFLVNLFHDPATNPNNAQLVFTTHETSILNQTVLRRDQIWFCEKDEDQATKLYPLTDFSPLKHRENLELSYLSGRYGALPFVRPLEKAD